MRGTSPSSRLCNGILSLDDTLLRAGRGDHAYLAEGFRGTTRTLATRFILEGKQQDECLLCVTLSESNSLT